MSFKCPACGYQTNKQKAIMETLRLLKKFPEDIQKLITKVAKAVNKKIYNNKMPAEYKYRFLYAIGGQDPTIIRRSINMYLHQNGIEKGQNLAYLSAIIRGQSETEDVRKVNERKMRGTNPPNLTNTKKEAKNAKPSYKRSDAILTPKKFSSSI